MADVTIRKNSYPAGREIKATAHYSYILNGITLDGSTFTANELVQEGTCLAKNDSTGMYEKYADYDDGAGNLSWPTGYSNPVIMDEAIQFKVDDAGNNPDVTVGQVLVHGAVYEGMLIGVTQIFKDNVGGAIRFVTE